MTPDRACATTPAARSPMMGTTAPTSGCRPPPRTIKPGPIEGRECGNGVIIDHGDGFETQYCHMAQNSIRVKPGERVKAGQPLGRVGISGKADFPHLHFTVRRRGAVVDPFGDSPSAGACATGTSLWA